MGWDDGVALNCGLYTPGESNGVKPMLSRTVDIATASSGAHITSSNQHVPETMRLLDAMIETEMMYSLYYGVQGTGWEYNAENGKIDAPLDVENFGTGTKTCLDANALFFAPSKYVNEVRNPSSGTLEKLPYCENYEDAGIVQTYSNQYLNLIRLTAEQNEEINLKMTDIKNYVNEHISSFISNGVTDDSWNVYVEEFPALGTEDIQTTYQEAIDQMDLQ